MIYAWVEDEAVINIIELDERNAEDFPACVSSNDKPVAIGDTYADGKFYRDGVEVLSLQEQLAQEREALNILMGVEE